MKVQALNTSNYTEINSNHKNQRQAKPSFGFLVPFATFIENNGFMGEFLSVDTFGMMGPRAGQGFFRNYKELGHLNYKAGREELVRELLSGPAYFFVPGFVLGMSALIAGKCANVRTSVIDTFKPFMQKAAKDLKNTQETKAGFVDGIVSKAFEGYTKETENIEKIKELLNKVVKGEMKPGKAGKEAQELLTTLNKANGKYLDHTNLIKLGEKEVVKDGSKVVKDVTYSISDIFKDVKNYLDHFAKKSSKTSETAEVFIEKFHKKAKDLRNASSILAIAALSAFLVIIPKLYQTGKKFPGKDGLVGAQEEQSNASNVKEGSNEN